MRVVHLAALCVPSISSSPTPAAPSALPTIRVASHSKRGEKNLLKIGKFDCQTLSFDR